MLNSTHCFRRREKLFGDGRPVPLDRNAKARIMCRARALMRRTVKGRAYGPVSAKTLAVLETLLWGFHNARSGLCFPSLDRIAEAAGCARSTVCEAIKALEAAGLLSWVHRLVRIRKAAPDLFGRMGSRWRVIRTSNGYRFHDPNPRANLSPVNPPVSSKSDLPSGTGIQELFPKRSTITQTESKLLPELERALSRLGGAIGVI